MPELRTLALVRIAEPALPIREAMDEQKLAELRDSLIADGLLQPIAVKAVLVCACLNTPSMPCPHAKAAAAGRGEYEIIAGHRRYMAARLAGWAEIPALVFQAGEIAQHAAMLAENIYREDLTTAEEALWFAELMEQKAIDTDGLAALVHQSRDYVEDRLRLLRGDMEIFHALRAREITFSVARELNKCTDAEHRHMLLDVARKGGHSARVVMGWIANWKAGDATAKSAPVAASDAVEQPAVEPYRAACILCDGEHDPYNMDVVHVHKYCRTHLEKILAETGLGARK